MSTDTKLISERSAAQQARAKDLLAAPFLLMIYSPLLMVGQALADTMLEVGQALADTMLEAAESTRHQFESGKDIGREWLEAIRKPHDNNE